MAALIWSAILVSANQGLPVLGGALEFTFPSTPAQHTHTYDGHMNAENNTHREGSYILPCFQCTLSTLYIKYYNSTSLSLLLPLNLNDVSLFVCLALLMLKLAIK